MTTHTATTSVPERYEIQITETMDPAFHWAVWEHYIWTWPGEAPHDGARNIASGFAPNRSCARAQAETAILRLMAADR